MPAAFFILIASQLVGEALRLVLFLPVPGPVIGMFLLAILLALRNSGKAAEPAPTPLDRTAGGLLTYMGLLFVPAGVGVITEFDLLQQQWLPIAGALAGSTWLGLVVTGLVMHRLARAPA